MSVTSSQAQAIDYEALSDIDLVARVQSGQHEAFRYLMQRCNQQLFRVARAVLGDDGEAEDALQEAYIRAFTRMADFRGEASVRTWMTRIVLNEAYGRLRRRRPTVDVSLIEQAQVSGSRVLPFPSSYGAEDPMSTTTRAQLREVAERAIESLPEPFRVVFIMREIDGYSTQETADALEIKPVTVKTRLYRARRRLHKELKGAFVAALDDAFPFLGKRCARITDSVMDRLERTDSGAD